MSELPTLNVYVGRKYFVGQGAVFEPVRHCAPKFAASKLRQKFIQL